MPEPVGTSGAEKTVPESAAAKSATPESGANGSEKKPGLEGRIAELSGELGRKNELIEANRKRIAELEKLTQTEAEKQAELIAETKYGPQMKELDGLKSWAATQRDKLLAKIPAEHAGLVLTGDNIPLQQQIDQANSVLALLQKGSPQPFSSGANPGNETKRTYTKTEFEKWKNTDFTTVAGREFYDKHKEEMQAAYREGRVEGLR